VIVAARAGEPGVRSLGMRGGPPTRRSAALVSGAGGSGERLSGRMRTVPIGCT
jgi:hypothetical protein